MTKNFFKPLCHINNIQQGVNVIKNPSHVYFKFTWLNGRGKVQRDFIDIYEPLTSIYIIYSLRISRDFINVASVNHLNIK